MMRQQPKRRMKCTSSRRYCQEKFSCPGLATEAAYFCNDCDSAQCQSCEQDIHSRKVSFEFHDRRTIEPPPDELLCQAQYINQVCKDRNFADVWCENCRIGFCFDCFADYHKNRKLQQSQHISISFGHHQKRMRERLDANIGIVTTQLGLAINPTSPVGDDDVLTFCSFPQTQSQNRPSESHQSVTATSEFDSAQMTMNSAHSTTSSGLSMPDVCLGDNMNLLTCSLDELDLCEKNDEDYSPRPQSFLLVDDKEELQIKDEKMFLQSLGCSMDAKVKIVSIFGNTGDGKSHTLNHTLFDGREVFKTSACQNSCTLGVWAAFDHLNNVIAVDTEGLLGSSTNDNKRVRLLLKILAVSDVVLYRTRAERLHKDMFVFLSNASKAYKKHFTEELQAASERFKIKESNLGPVLIVFQETAHTAPLAGESNRSPDALLRDMFVKGKFEMDAFSEICYVGTKTSQSPTNFERFQKVLLTKLKDHSIRAARSPAVMFQSLKMLNDKFSSNIENVKLDTFPEQYFTCTAACHSCNSRCIETMNHNAKYVAHDAGRDVHCTFNSSLGNKVFLCKKCSLSGRKNVVVPKASESSASALSGFTTYLLSGYVLECSTCGVIYRSRQHWYGNPSPDSAVLVEVRHVWPESNRALQGTHNAAQKLVDGVSYFADTISSVSAIPAKYLGEWTADQIAPAYWIPNYKILSCNKCEVTFTTNEQKHHCRACGQGFCDECSSKKRLVPERGWGSEAVRVCDGCFEGNCAGGDVGKADMPVTARKVGEAVSSTLGVFASALTYPKNFLKNQSRPEYWVADDDIKQCVVCEQEFNSKRLIHHCRACGQGVCNDCSPARRPVPLRGWDSPVRVCTLCENKGDM